MYLVPKPAGAAPCCRRGGRKAPGARYGRCCACCACRADRCSGARGAAGSVPAGGAAGGGCALQRTSVPAAGAQGKLPQPGDAGQVAAKCRASSWGVPLGCAAADCAVLPPVVSGPPQAEELAAAERAALDLLLAAEALRRRVVHVGAQYRALCAWLLTLLRRWAVGQVDRAGRSCWDQGAAA